MEKIGLEPSVSVIRVVSWICIILLVYFAFLHPESKWSYNTEPLLAKASRIARKLITPVELSAVLCLGGL